MSPLRLKFDNPGTTDSGLKTGSQRTILVDGISGVRIIYGGDDYPLLIVFNKDGTIADKLFVAESDHPYFVKANVRRVRGIERDDPETEIYNRITVQKER